MSALGRAGLRALPGVGAAVAGGVATGVALRAGMPGAPRRRRGRGFSARDIRQTRRMLRLIKDMMHACPQPRRVSAPRSCK